MHLQYHLPIQLREPQRALLAALQWQLMDYPYRVLRLHRRRSRRSHAIPGRERHQHDSGGMACIMVSRKAEMGSLPLPLRDFPC